MCLLFFVEIIIGIKITSIFIKNFRDWIWINTRFINTTPSVSSPKEKMGCNLWLRHVHVAVKMFNSPFTMETATPLMTHSYKSRLYVYTQKLKLKAKRDGIEWQEWLNYWTLRLFQTYEFTRGQAPFISWKSYCKWRIVDHRCNRAC